MKLKPCDCIDEDRQLKLFCTGVKINDYHMYLDSGKVVYERLGFRCTIPMRFFKAVAEWYLEPQDVKST